MSSALATYVVGVYSNREFLGKSTEEVIGATFSPTSHLGTGTTVSIAEEMAARDALRRLFETDEQRAPIPFDKLFKTGLLIERNK